VPRGGVIAVTGTIDGEKGAFTLTATGVNARIPHNAQELIAGNGPNGVIDAHAVQPYYTGQIARAAGMDVRFAIEGDTVTITATQKDD
jgi:histidine phosphotransferase ChpT